MSFCNQCGNNLPENSLFCNTCGAKVLIPTDEDSKEVPNEPDLANSSDTPEEVPINKLQWKIISGDRCPECNGTGKDEDNDDCLECDGKGKVNIHYECPFCNGTGKDYEGAACLKCNCKGYLDEEGMDDADFEWEFYSDHKIRATCFCKKCKGTGKVKDDLCENCNGDGFIFVVDCPECNGTGKKADGSKCNLCKGKTLIKSSEIERLEYSFDVADEFKKHFIRFLVSPFICLIIAAISSRYLFNMLKVDIALFKTLSAEIAAFILTASICGLFDACKEVFTHFSECVKSLKFKLGGIGILVLGIIVAIIAGPVTGGYGWMEGEAKRVIDTNLASTPYKCESVNISNKEKDIYYGSAFLSDGKEHSFISMYQKTDSDKESVNYKIFVQFLN